MKTTKLLLTGVLLALVFSFNAVSTNLTVPGYKATGLYRGDSIYQVCYGNVTIGYSSSSSTPFQVGYGTMNNSVFIPQWRGDLSTGDNSIGINIQDTITRYVYISPDNIYSSTFNSAYEIIYIKGVPMPGTPTSISGNTNITTDTVTFHVSPIPNAQKYIWDFLSETWDPSFSDTTTTDSIFLNNLPSDGFYGELKVYGLNGSDCNGGSIILQNIYYFPPVSTGINQTISNHNDNLSVYPNPSTGIVNIKSEWNSTIEVYSSLGEMVYETKSPSGLISFDTAELPKGVYFVTSYNENNKSVKKIIIQ